MKFSIADALNDFGQISATGNLPNNIYVGNNGDKTVHSVFPNGDDRSQGGEIGIPYFAEYSSSKPLTKDTVLTVEGAPDNGGADAPASGWVTAGTLTVAAGLWTPGAKFRVAFSDSPYKWFRAKVAFGAGETAGAVVSAILYRG